MATRYNFAPAAPEATDVYGASAPGFNGAAPPEAVDDWIAFVRDHDVERVCCLLNRRLDRYDDLLGDYRTAFGDENVLAARNEDHAPLDVDLFTDDVLPFLRAGAATGERTVVHCWAGVGRTGQVLVGWLARERGYAWTDALETVRSETAGYRAPLEGSETDREHVQRLCGGE